MFLLLVLLLSSPLRCRMASAVDDNVHKQNGVREIGRERGGDATVTNRKQKDSLSLFSIQ